MRKSKLSVSEDLRRNIKAGLKNEIPLSPNIFDSMQKHIENTIRDNIYPSFLCSEMYILYIQQMSAAHERFSSSSGGPNTGGLASCSTGSSSSSGASCGSNNGGGGGGACALPFAGASTSTGKVSSTLGPIINLPASTSAVMGAPTAGSCSASGSVYGPSTSASSSGSVSATDTLPRSSTLPTLHEDSELSLSDDFEKLRVEGGRMSSADMPMGMRLTRDLLLATQNRRLEIRPPG